MSNMTFKKFSLDENFNRIDFRVTFICGAVLVVVFHGDCIKTEVF